MIPGTSLGVKHNILSQLEISKPAHWIFRGHICSLLCHVEPFSCIQVLAQKTSRRKPLPSLILFPTTLFSVTSGPFRWRQVYSTFGRKSLVLTSPILTGKGLEKALNCIWDQILKVDFSGLCWRVSSATTSSTGMNLQTVVGKAGPRIFLRGIRY